MQHIKLNPFFKDLDIDYLYHLGIDSSMDLLSVFANIKYVIFTQDDRGAGIIANQFAKKWYNIEECSFTYTPIYKTERFHLYKIGPVIIISHGIGIPSLLICINEITKLFYHLKNDKVMFFKINFVTGLNLSIGDIVISTKALDTAFKPCFTNIECGIENSYNTYFDTQVIQEVMLQGSNLSFLNIGKSISTSDFYEEQVKLDGALNTPYTQEELTKYLTNAKDVGVRIFSMEDTAYSAFCHALSIKCCSINCISSIYNYNKNNLNSDSNKDVTYINLAHQLRATYEIQQESLQNAINIVHSYIFDKINNIIERKNEYQ